MTECQPEHLEDLTPKQLLSIPTSQNSGILSRRWPPHQPCQYLAPTGNATTASPTDPTETGHPKKKTGVTWTPKKRPPADTTRARARNKRDPRSEISLALLGAVAPRWPAKGVKARFLGKVTEYRGSKIAQLTSDRADWPKKVNTLIIYLPLKWSF